MKKQLSGLSAQSRLLYAMIDVFKRKYRKYPCSNILVLGTGAVDRPIPCCEETALSSVEKQLDVQLDQSLL